MNRTLVQLAFIAGCACTEAGCRREPEPSPGAAQGSAAFPTFSDVAAACGVDFVHENGFDGSSYRVVETVSGGVALLDANLDGCLDIYFTNGARLAAAERAPRNALFVNAGRGSFRDASASSGTDDELFSLGCAVADVNGDGYPDIYVTNLGPNRLYLNRGDGTFEDVARKAGVALESMDSGCVFFDMDEDGDLDLYVASYVVDERHEHPPAVVRGIPGYWPPLNYAPAPHHLFRNEGDGTFRDVSEAAGIRVASGGRGLGVIAADLNNDGHQDLYVANDMSANFLFLGDGKGRFEEVGVASGTAFGSEGEHLGSMGVDAADYDQDGLLDLVVTNYQSQLNNLYRAVDGGFFEDSVRESGIGAGNLAEVAWGVGFTDLDRDGWRDLAVINGHLNPRVHEMDQSTTYPQRKRFFRSLGNGRFADVSQDAGEPGRVAQVGRGAAFGDLDNDGDVDIVVLNSGGRAEVLRNDCQAPGSWVLVQLAGGGLNRDAIGARVTVRAGGRTQAAERRSAASYLSANDPRLFFGLGAAERLERLEVRWPDRSVEVHEDLPARRLLVVEKGSKDVTVRELRALKLGDD